MRPVADVFSPEILANHVGILGKTGSGKSNLAKVIAEQLLRAGQRVCVLDPTGTWYGLRLTRNQRPSPYKVVIFGGAHGDIPIAEHHGDEIAAALAKSSTSAIIDTRQMTVRARTRFATEFAETLLRRNAGILYVIVDESHLFAPQGKVPDHDAGKMLHAWNNLASLGRGVGLVLILISQRPAKLHKDSLTQIETLVAMRLIGPQDRAAVREWIKESADETVGREIMASLPSLPTGTGWVWSPGLDILRKRSFPLASTLDTGKPSEAPDVALGPIDVDAIRAQLGKVEEERKANDPKLLQAEIRRLEGEVRLAMTTTNAVPVERIVEKVVDRPYFDQEMRDEIEEILKQIRQHQSDVDHLAVSISSKMQVATMKAPPPVREQVRQALKSKTTAELGELFERQVTKRPTEPLIESVPAPSNGTSLKVGKGERTVLGVLRQWPSGRTYNELAFLAGYSANASTLGVILSKLRQLGYIAPGNQPVVLTPEGVGAAGGMEELPTGEALLGHWLQHPRMGKGERDVLRVLISTFPRDLSNDELCELAGYSPTASTIGVILSKLRKLGLVEKGARRLAPEFAGAIDLSVEAR